MCFEYLPVLPLPIIDFASSGIQVNENLTCDSLQCAILHYQHKYQIHTQKGMKHLPSSATNSNTPECILRFSPLLWISNNMGYSM